MIISEENINEIFDIERLESLEKRLKIALPALDSDLKTISSRKTGKGLAWADKELVSEKYKTVVNDLWKLKNVAYDILTGIKFGKYSKQKYIKVVPICYKILSMWSGDKGDIYHKLLRINEAIDEYNERFPKYKLIHIDELIGIPIKASVVTEEVNYFPY